MRRVVAGLLAIGMCASAARAQEPLARRLARLDAPTRASVIAIADSARAGGLPVEPLVQKALEGASKQADGARILGAVRRLRADLTAARDALGVSSSEAELVAGAAALRAGVSTETLRQVRRQRRANPVAVPLGVLAELVARGVPVADAASSVTTMLGREARDEALVAFGRDVERDIAIGAPPASAASARTRLSTEGASAASPGVDLGVSNSGNRNSPAPKQKP